LKRTLDAAGRPAGLRSSSGQSSGQDGLAADVIMAMIEWPAGVLKASGSERTWAGRFLGRLSVCERERQPYHSKTLKGHGTPLRPQGSPIPKAFSPRREGTPGPTLARGGRPPAGGQLPDEQVARRDLQGFPDLLGDRGLALSRDLGDGCHVRPSSNTRTPTVMQSLPPCKSCSHNPPHRGSSARASRSARS